MISDGKNTFLLSGVNSDIVDCWEATYEKYKDQPKELAQYLTSGCIGVDDKCQKIFGYMVENTRYMLDPDGVQMIKSPARLLKDGCGDCKSYTMFIASCLHCAGIPCKVRFVSFDGGDQYTHVYPVAVDEYGREIPMDACELDSDGVTVLYNYARPYKRKKEFNYN